MSERTIREKERKRSKAPSGGRLGRLSVKQEVRTRVRSEARILGEGKGEKRGGREGRGCSYHLLDDLLLGDGRKSDLRRGVVVEVSEVGVALSLEGEVAVLRSEGVVGGVEGMAEKTNETRERERERRLR